MIFFLNLQVSLWPEITACVPIELVGTAIGLTNVFGGSFAGLTSLGVGKLLDRLNKKNKGHPLDSWRVIMLLLLGIEILSAVFSLLLASKDLNGVSSLWDLILFTEMITKWLYHIETGIVLMIPTYSKCCTRKLLWYLLEIRSETRSVSPVWLASSVINVSDKVNTHTSRI